MKGYARGISAFGTLFGVIFIVIALGVIWFATGGPSRTSEHGKPFFSLLPGPFGGGATSTNFVGGFSPSNNNPGTSGTGTSNDTPPPQPPRTVSSRFGLGTLTLDSPYADMVFLGGAGVGQTDPKKEYLVIETPTGLNRTITITGWTLINSTGISIKIPQAASLPFLGQVNVDAPITIGGGASVSIVSGRSPNGTSFRLNQCTGYFEQYQDFVPGLPKKCPTSQEEFDRLYSSNMGGFNDRCINFLNSIARCEFVSSAPPTDIGSECQNFALNTLSYNGCINAHKNEPGFYQNEWRVYLNRDQEIWKNRDEIRLLDENGKIVDVVSY